MTGNVINTNHLRLAVVRALTEPSILFLSVWLAAWLRFGGGIEFWPANSLTPLWPKALVFTLAGVFAMVSTGLYNPRLRDGLPGVMVRLAVAHAFLAVLVGVVFYVVPSLELGRGVLGIALAVSLVSLGAFRWLHMGVLARQQVHRRVLVLGAGVRASHLLRFRRRTDFIGIDFVGFVPMPGDDLHVPEDRCVDLEHDLRRYVALNGIDQLVIAVDDRRHGLPMEALLACRTQGVDVVDLVSFLEKELGLLKLDIMNPGWLVFSPGFNKRMFRLWVKRLFDVLVSGSLLVATLPLMLLTALAIWLESGGRGPILYRQVRVGEEGVPFELIKFRSMKVDAEAGGKAQWAQKSDPRVTRIGRFIRKYRVDELPQLINILSGRMSFVGPRPERPEFVTDLERQVPYYAERHRVKPGLTGWAQVRYPYGSSREDAFQKLQFDLYYAKNHSVLMDVSILLQTAEVVLLGRGAR